MLELFVAPVDSPYDNPTWYLEVDAGATGVLWGGLTYNPVGWKSPFEGGNFSGGESCQSYVRGHPGACSGGECVQNKTGDINACALSCRGKAEFVDGLTTSLPAHSGRWPVPLAVRVVCADIRGGDVLCGEIVRILCRRTSSYGIAPGNTTPRSNAVCIAGGGTNKRSTKPTSLRAGTGMS